MFNKLSINSLDSDCEIYFSNETHSKTENFREIIRKEIYTRLKKTGYNNLDSILDLSTPPTHPGVDISLSHSQEASAFILHFNNKNVGIDVESLHRIKPEIIKRIASSEEIRSCPDEKLLFTSKEATWKATNREFNIPTISQVETSHWNKTPQGLYHFIAHFNDSKLSGAGCTHLISDTYLSFFIYP